MKNLKKLGKALDRAEQKNVFGGNGPNRLTKAEPATCYRQVHLDPCPDAPGFPDQSTCWALEYIC